MKRPKTFKDSIDYYSQNIENKIRNLLEDFNFVYHLRHPFEINLEGPSEIYNSKLEETRFEYELTNLILEHFGTTQGFSDAILISDEKLLNKIVREDFKLQNSMEWYAIKRNGIILDFNSNKEFYSKFHKLANSYYKKEDGSDYYNHDSIYYNTNWAWQDITWKDLIAKYSMDLKSPIRFSSIQLWMYENGSPRNIKYPKEWLKEEIKTLIKISVLDDKIRIVEQHDAYVTLVGSDTNLSQVLKDYRLEFDEEHKR